MVGKPSFTFHNVSASAGFHKEFAADLNWYSNISLAMRKSFEFLVTVCIILLGLSSWEISFRQRSSSQTIHNGAEKMD
jgi:hypothetical protein